MTGKSLTDQLVKLYVTVEAETLKELERLPVEQPNLHCKMKTKIKAKRSHL